MEGKKLCSRTGMSVGWRYGICKAQGLVSGVDGPLFVDRTDNLEAEGAAPH